MAHTNVQLVSGNLTTGGADPTFFIDRVNNKIGIGGVPDTSGDDSSNVLQVTGSMLATKYHGDGSSLTGLFDSKWLESSGDATKIYYNGGNVGIGTTTPTQILDVGSSLSNPFICRHLSGSLHATDKRDSVSFGRIDGSDFLGMKCRVDTHTNLGYGTAANQTKIGFFTWGNAIANSREVMSILGNGNVGIGTTSPQALLHVNGNKAIINGQSSVQTVNVYKTSGGNGSPQTKRYYRVYVPNGYNNFQIIFKGFARNNGGGGDIGRWSRHYTVQRNHNANIVIAERPGGDLASGFTFATSQSGGVTGTIEVHFDVTFPPKPEYATYITFKAEVIGDNGGFANTSGI